MLKLSLIFASIIYYSCSLKKITCKHVITIIKENIGEGEGEENEEEEEHENEERHGLKKIHEQNPTSNHEEKKNKQENSKNGNKGHHDRLESTEKPIILDKNENNEELKEIVLSVDENKKSNKLPIKSENEIN